MRIQRTEKQEKNSKKIPVYYYSVTGGLAGFFNGLFGGGGGMVVVPMLIYLLRKNPKTAHATAILIILPLSVLSGIFYASFGSFDFTAGIPVSVGVIIGGIVGALLLSKLSSKRIMFIFALAMAVAGVKLLFF